LFDSIGVTDDPQCPLGIERLAYGIAEPGVGGKNNVRSGSS
jgi:hypothetical protein